jgi:hypothetical protein
VTRPKPTLISMVLQGVLMELFVRHHVSVDTVRVICSAAGWSCRRLPLEELTTVCVRAALNAASSHSLDAIYSLRLLVAFGGLPVLDTITNQLGLSQRSGTSSSNGKSGAASSSSATVDSVLALLLSFVVVDFGVVDPRDDEWRRMATYLQEFLSTSVQQAAKHKGGKDGAIGTEAMHAAVSLLYMSTTEPSSLSAPTTPLLGAGGESSTVSNTALEQCWSCAAKWWSETEKPRRAASTASGSNSLGSSLLLRRLEELFDTIRSTSP